ncbi:MAG: hypothetical protein A4S09_03560 [Proteobacteria bacterium SG_bin7]|nr:MAG: hypothetical protein A4S09_03560 [Proteobacteria bacterium SG_bin7]
MWIYVVISFFINFADASPLFFECQNVVSVKHEDLGQACTDTYILCLKTLKSQGVKGFDLHSRCQSSNIRCEVKAYEPVDAYDCEVLAKILRVNPSLVADEVIKNSCLK